MASDVVVTVVGHPNDVREVILGPEGVLWSSRPSTIVVDMTTSDPSLAVEVASRASAQGVHTIDAPVFGGDVGARGATLAIMVGGDAAALKSLTTISRGAVGSWQFSNLGPHMLARDFEQGICRRPLRQGHGHRPRRVAADEACPFRPGPRPVGVRRGLGPGGRATGAQALVCALGGLSNLDRPAAQPRPQAG